jgi:hypothetical protein
MAAGNHLTLELEVGGSIPTDDHLVLQQLEFLSGEGAIPYNEPAAPVIIHLASSGSVPVKSRIVYGQSFRAA